MNSRKYYVLREAMGAYSDAQMIQGFSGSSSFFFVVVFFSCL